MPDLDAPAPMRTLFQQQLAKSTRSDGVIDQNMLAELVTKTYVEFKEKNDTQDARYVSALDYMAQGLCLFDSEQRLVFSNKRYAEIYDLQPEHVRPGATLQEIIERRHLKKTAPAMSGADYLLWRTGVAQSHQPVEQVVDLQNGHIVVIRHQPMPDGAFLATHEDITARRESERKIADTARRYVGTGLLNREALAEQLQEMLGRLPEQASCAVLLLSVDGADALHDAHGRVIGDELLHSIADRLRRFVHATDLLGQQAPHEFIIVRCEALHVAGAIRLAESLLSLVAAPIALQEQKLVVSASIGISVVGASGRDVQSLLQNANIALNAARTGSRGNFRLFEPDMDLQVQARRLLEHDLRETVDHMAFELHYQPQIDLATREVRGFEALLRWNHPIRGSVLPAAFIPLAEELGLIGQIGGWVVTQACAEAAKWPADITIAVNVSPLQFKDGLLERQVASALECSGLAPHRLELEITETCMIEDATAVAATLQALRAIGVRIALDDFGTGYSSLSYLPRMPFDKIKIDRSFVSKLGTGRRHTAIVRAIVDLCAGLEVGCIAEGVETDEQWQILMAENCIEGQGYLFGRPGPASHIPALLQASTASGLNTTEQARISRAV